MCDRYHAQRYGFYCYFIIYHMCSDMYEKNGRYDHRDDGKRKKNQRIGGGKRIISKERV